MFKILLLVAFSYCQEIDVNFGYSNQWTDKKANCLNCTYKISSKQNRFIYVHVILQIANPSFYLVSQEQEAVGYYYYSQYSDMTSAYENRLTRFLKIENTHFPLYVTILDSEKQTPFQIIIKNSDELECDNNCSNNGDCQDEGCVCYESYIGNNCNQWATKITEEDDGTFTQNVLLQYYYIEKKEYEGKTLYMDLETEDINGILFFQQLTEAIVITNVTDEYRMEELVWSFTISRQDPMYLQLTVPDDVKINDYFVFVTQNTGGNIQSEFTLNFYQEPGEGYSLSVLEIAGIVIAMGFLSIMFVIAGFYLVRKHGSKIQQE